MTEEYKWSVTINAVDGGYIITQGPSAKFVRVGIEDAMSVVRELLLEQEIPPIIPAQVPA